MSALPNPPIDYTSKDYSAFRQNMLDSISTRLPAWQSRSPNDFGVVLIELFAYMGDNLSYYGDRIANEAFIDTAVQRASVFALSKLLNYRPTGNGAAGTSLQITTDGVTNVFLPAKTQVKTAFTLADTGAAVIFETDADLTITAPATSGTVTATQGQTITNEGGGTSDGTSNQAFALSQNPVIDGSVSVRVNEGNGFVLWTYYEHLIDAHGYDLGYTLYTDENGVVYIQFGDSVNGHIPAIGSPITATYRVGGGARGNVIAGAVTQLVSPVVGVTAVTNTTVGAGGADAETLDQIRINAPKNLSALSRAVTLADYSTLATQVTGVAIANAVSSVYTSVTVYIAPIGGGTPSTTLKNTVSNYLATRIPIGTTVTMQDPTYIALNATLAVQVLAGYGREVTRLAVVNAVSQLFANANVSFGQRITASNVYNAVSKVVGVDYSTLSLLVRTTDPQSGIADVVLNPNEIPSLGTLTVTANGGVVV